MEKRAVVEQQKNEPGWIAILSLSLLSVYAYVVLEWFFFATKPSFMSSMGIWDQVAVVTISPLAPALITASLVLLLRIPGLVFRGQSLDRFLARIAALIPTIVIALALFILIDNFTYTVFGFGVGTSSEDQSWIYVLRALFLLILSWVWVVKRLIRVDASKAKARAGLCLLLMLVSFSVAAWRYAPGLPESVGNQATRTHSRPDILLFASDGLNAAHLSLYGFRRDTTPFLRELAEDALVCDNAFSNSAHTGASIASMLTGRLPVSTRLVYPPDILHGEDVYRHLPAVLRNLGYRNADISIRYYADAPDMNMRNSFDYANSRRFEMEFLAGEARALFGQEVAYFDELMVQRVRDRFSHLMGLTRMGDAFAQLAGTESKMARADSERLKELFHFIDESPEPYFAHVHLMGTHEPFRPNRRVFSNEQSAPNSMDAYDDTILEFDNRVRELVEFLKARNRFANTLLIVNSDHGLGFRTDVRLPLFFRFPDGAHGGKVATNTQNLDIAPTILDYLGLENSPWMEGHSLLGTHPDTVRPIYSASRPPGTAFARGPFWQLDQEQLEAPFYSLGVVTMILCNSWFRFDLGKGTLTSGLVRGHTQPCSEKPSPGIDEARNIIVRHLEDNGFDTSSLADKD